MRLFAKSLEEITAEKQEKVSNPNSGKPLLNLNFSTHGKLSRKNEEIKAILMRLGGKLVATIDNLTVALITNESMHTCLTYLFNFLSPKICLI